MIIKAREEQLDDQTCIRWARRNECIFEFIFNLEGEVWWNILIGAEPGDAVTCTVTNEAND
jgi:hypothetical protein